MTHIDSKRIGPFPNNHTGFKRFVEGLIEAGAEGFETPKESFNTLAGIQRGAALRITLYKYEAATSEVVIEEDRASIIKEAILSADKVGKADLLWFASENGIEIPEDIKLPLQIRKYIKEALESKD